jgi:hypothetical protein
LNSEILPVEEFSELQVDLQMNDVAPATEQE